MENAGAFPFAPWRRKNRSMLLSSPSQLRIPLRESLIQMDGISKRGNWHLTLCFNIYLSNRQINLPHTLIEEGRIEERGKREGIVADQYVFSPLGMPGVIDLTVSEVGRADPSSEGPFQITWALRKETQCQGAVRLTMGVGAAKGFWENSSEWIFRITILVGIVWL